MTTVTDPEVIAAVTADLKAFGYSSATEAKVKEEIEVALTGKQPGLLGLFAVDLLKRAGLWPEGEP
jgi:threonine dehydrogenase-like Zn-dependent dehydrogenase